MAENLLAAAGGAGAAAVFDPDFALGIIDMCDENPKNLFPTPDATGSAGSWLNVDCDLPVGEYVMQFQTLSSTHATPTSCRAAFYTESWQMASVYIQFPQGSVVSKPFTLTKAARKFRINPYSDNNFANTDVVSFTGAMVCKKGRWVISHAYVPYHQPDAQAE